MTAYGRNFLILMILAVAALVVYNIFILEQRPPAITYSAFLNSLEKNEIKAIQIRGGEVSGRDVFERDFSTFSPDPGGLLARLEGKDITITTAPGPDSGGASHIVPWVLLIGIWIFFMFFQQKGGGISRVRGCCTFRKVFGWQFNPALENCPQLPRTHSAWEPF